MIEDILPIGQEEIDVVAIVRHGGIDLAGIGAETGPGLVVDGAWIAIEQAVVGEVVLEVGAVAQEEERVVRHGKCRVDLGCVRGEAGPGFVGDAFRVALVCRVFGVQVADVLAVFEEEYLGV